MMVTLAPVQDDAAIEEAIAIQAREPAGGGLISLPDSFNTRHRDTIIAAATHHKFAANCTPDFPEAGALMSYMFNPVDLHAQAASYIDRILKGASPGGPSGSGTNEVLADH